MEEPQNPETTEATPPPAAEPDPFKGPDEPGQGGDVPPQELDSPTATDADTPQPDATPPETPSVEPTVSPWTAFEQAHPDLTPQMVAEMVGVLQRSPEAAEALVRAASASATSQTAPQAPAEPVKPAAPASPEQFMPVGQEFDALEALRPGTPSFSAQQQYVGTLAQAATEKAMEGERQQRQAEQLRADMKRELLVGVEKIREEFGADDNRVKEFVGRWYAGEINPVDIYRGMYHPELVQKAVDAAVNERVQKLALEMFNRYKEDGAPIPSTVSAPSAGSEQPQSSEELDPFLMGR